MAACRCQRSTAVKVHRFFALAITCMLLQVCNAYSPRGRMRPLWRPTRSRQRDTGEAKRVERPVESGEGEPPLAAVGVPGVAPRLGQESLICPQVQVPKASSSSLWRTKPKGGLGIRATRTLLHRLSALAGATAFGSEFSLRVQVAWTVQADCPVAYEELFSSPHVDVVHSLSNCKRWIPGLKTMIEFCRFVNRTIISDPGGQFPDMCTGNSPPAIYAPTWASILWFRQLTPSSSVSATVLDFKNQLKWDRFTWVGIHLMRLAAELHLRSGNHTAEGLAPLSSYMYEMMMLKYKHDPGDKPLRFLIISEDKGAVAKLTEMAAPAFQRNQFVPWTRQGMNITFGLNTKEGLKTSAADMFLLANATYFIYSRYSAFAAFTRHVRGQKHSVAVGTTGVWDFSMSSVL